MAKLSCRGRRVSTASALVAVMALTNPGCAADDSRTAESETTTTTASTSGSSTTTNTASGGVGKPTSEPPADSSAWPPALTDELRHGDDVFGVYLAVEHSQTAPGPKAHQAVADAAAAGYETGVGTDISCDSGAREQLGLDPTRDYAAVVLYFRTQEDAQRFVDLFEPGVVGTAQVTVMCLD